MTPDDFQFIADLLKKRSGLMLSPDKLYLLENRLLPVARKNGFTGLNDLITRLRSGRDEPLAVEVTEAMTTNESFFFRDKIPFESFKNKILPHLLDARSDQKKMRVWCAAASSGQEPYSLVMTLRDAQAKLAGWQNEIIGTDISNEILNKAKEGLYTQFEVQRGMAVQNLVKYFDQEGDQWRIKPDLRSAVKYRQFNLLDGFQGLGRFDVIFCRNVLIYFDQETKKGILERMADQLAVDGYLLLGAAETVIGITDAFEPVKGERGLYVRKAADQKSRPSAVTSTASQSLRSATS